MAIYEWIATPLMSLAVKRNGQRDEAPSYRNLKKHNDTGFKIHRWKQLSSPRPFPIELTLRAPFYFIFMSLNETV